MWTLTSYGFFSIVQKPEDKARGTLTIRARVKNDLQALKDRYLLTMGEIIEHEGSDYRFRAVADRDAVSDAMKQAVADIDYSNFKNAVAEEQGCERADRYNDVWAILYGLQDQHPSHHGW